MARAAPLSPALRPGAALASWIAAAVLSSTIPAAALTATDTAADGAASTVAAGAGGDPHRPVHDPADLRPEAPLPPDALVPGAAGVTVLICSADPPPMDASGALGAGTAAPAPGPARIVRVDDPWAAHPVMTGRGNAAPARFFKRGRTLIFDAGAETLYIERDHRSFTYTASFSDGVTTWHGSCRAMSGD